MNRPFSFSGVLLIVGLSSFAAKAGPREWLDTIDAKIFGRSNEAQSFYRGVTLYQSGKIDEALPQFQAAAQSADRLVRAKALHNIALVQIQQKQMKQALQSLRDAAAYDNESVEIKENLQWLMARLKEEEQHKDQPKDQNQKNDRDKDQTQNQDQKTAEQKNQTQNQDQKTAEQKDQGSSGTQKQANQDKTGKDGNPDKGKEQPSAEPQKGQEKKTGGQGDDKQVAEAKDGNSEGKDKDQGGEGRPSEPKAKTAGDQSPTDPADKNLKSQGRSVASQPVPPKEGQEKDAKTEGQMLLTPGEIKQQEAERLLRTIDDRIGRYPLTDTEATSKRGNDGKNW
jgi:hypothetical protein